MPLRVPSYATRTGRDLRNSRPNQEGEDRHGFGQVVRILDDPASGFGAGQHVYCIAEIRRAGGSTFCFAAQVVHVMAKVGGTREPMCKTWGRSKRKRVDGAGHLCTQIEGDLEAEKRD